LATEKAILCRAKLSDRRAARRW
jgi:hypothetical protein